MERKLFYEVYSLERYTKDFIDKLSDYEIFSAMHLLNNELQAMTRPKNIISEKLLKHYEEKLNMINNIFRNIYNDLFNRTYNFTNDDIVNFNYEYNQKYSAIKNLIESSKKEMKLKQAI